MEKKTETIDGKRPWEAGFDAEESQQKAAARQRKGDDPKAISDTLDYSKTNKGS